jgi:hypothetical protein
MTVVPPALALALAITAWIQVPTGGQKPAPDTTDWSAVDRAIGRPGALLPGGVHKYAFPRSDLHVRVGGVVIRPALALGGWVAFKGAGNNAMAMGDLVLLQREVTPVLTKLQEMGVSETALHNHLLHESPRLMYMHIEAEGDPVKIAEALHAALALTKTPPAQPAGGAPTASFGLDTAGVAAILGRRGQINGGVYQVSVPRATLVRVEGMEVPPSMGVTTGINFQPTGGGKAAITGDFVLAPEEVHPVIQALRAAGIEVTALHSHMLTEEPRLFFMHFWANDDALTLARGLRTALDRTKSKPATS